MRITFLCTGQMGSAIASLLIKSGHSLTVWNRTKSSLQPLLQQGATAASSPAEAAKASEIVFTMPMDDAALEEIVFGRDGLLEGLPENAVHVSLSTISVQLSQKLTVEHATRKQNFVAAPVFGRPNVAAEGKLWIVAAGKPDAVDRVKPLLESFSRGITVVGDKPYKAHALKIGGNFLITAMIASLSEGFVYAESQSIDPALYIEAVNAALFQSQFYAAYSKVMLHPPETPGATIAIGQKDTRLFRDAAAATNTQTPLADHFQDQLQRASEAGLRDRDWAAGYYQFVRSISHRRT
ncbi:NAD(P)-dependent oxidoreductase [Alloacidobacterium dinghuense]|uniref:NAD(P)-dependent oxidoreductase n=1 Tax=Alloacidobacterium dinghuense TaxID=2763107 RepID=A0A7G8BIY8_9BACT|nr:NAD(P)-dependent oxidoreductase [Alloacidobacterium dinghuense]QNI32508.1 NAD(P)-dependent oxidoreductase [Alloacidobacterium dinghuense]